MMQITHAATAAAIGTQTENIYLAFFGAIFIHFLIDKIPHYWTTVQKEKTLILVVDYFLTVTFIGFLAYFNFATRATYAALFGALATDIILVGIPKVYNGKIGKWHTERQPHKPGYLFLLTDLAVILVSLAIVYYSVFYG